MITENMGISLNKKSDYRNNKERLSERGKPEEESIIGGQERFLPHVFAGFIFRKIDACKTVCIQVHNAAGSAYLGRGGIKIETGFAAMLGNMPASVAIVVRFQLYGNVLNEVEKPVLLHLEEADFMLHQVAVRRIYRHEAHCQLYAQQEANSCPSF
jgi:hypothetical protein